MQNCVDANILLLAPNWLHRVQIQTIIHSQNKTHCGVRGKGAVKGRFWATEQRICVLILFRLFKHYLPLTHAQLHTLTSDFVIPAHKPGDISVAYLDKLLLNYGSSFNFVHLASSWNFSRIDMWWNWAWRFLGFLVVLLNLSGWKALQSLKTASTGKGTNLMILFFLMILFYYSYYSHLYE